MISQWALGQTVTNKNLDITIRLKVNHLNQSFFCSSIKFLLYVRERVNELSAIGGRRYRFPSSRVPTFPDRSSRPKDDCVRASPVSPCDLPISSKQRGLSTRLLAWKRAHERGSYEKNRRPWFRVASEMAGAIDRRSAGYPTRWPRRVNLLSISRVLSRREIGGGTGGGETE